MAAASSSVRVSSAPGLTALAGPVQRLMLPLGLPWIGTNLRLDALSGFFLVLVGIGGGGASLFALGYGRHEAHPERVLPFYPAFLAGMALVVVADDAFTFLFAWELMSLTSWALVMAHHQEEGNARAGFIYLLMATFSGLALLLGFGLLAGAQGDYAFDSIRQHPPDALVGAVVLVVALIGAGSKAGLVPLHVWLPLAHPAAPSHVSALMSGVMTKVAIYGFIRIVFDLLGPNAWWAGTVVLALGGITAVLGVLHALMERDLKRLLAYSTVENIGIIFIGLGLALAFRATGFQAGAALALTAALFHALNHTLFKSLLFFGVWRRAERHWGARHGDDGRADPSHAADRFRLPGGLHGDLRIAAAERFRLGMADVPGRAAAPRAAAMGPEADDPGRWRGAGVGRGPGVRLLRPRIWHRVPRPSAHRMRRLRHGRPIPGR